MYLLHATAIPESTSLRITMSNTSKESDSQGADGFLAACKSRRTIYSLAKCPQLSDDRVIHLVNESILHTPSSFNSQSTRALVLLGDAHEYLWNDITKPTVLAVAPKEAWPASENKDIGFRRSAWHRESSSPQNTLY